jgi:PAS domain S-box-containing protein
MFTAPLPADEVSRLQSLHDLRVLDTEPEAQFDALVKVASLVCGVPVSLISLVDADRQWFKANVGLPGVNETPRDLAFCSHTILGEAIFEVCDAALDPRFSDNPLVTGGPTIRFYAGAPVRLSSGECIGTLCVIDRQPRQLDAHQREILTQLALVAARALEGRRALAAERRLLEEQSHVMALLRESQTLLDRTGRMAGVGGWTIDLASKAVMWSDEICRILGVAPGYQPTLEEAFNLYPPEARPVIQGAVEQCMATGQGWDLELPLIRVDGRRIWTRSVGALDSFDGVPVRLVGAFQNVSESRAQRQAVVDARERIEAATDSGEIGIWDYDLESGVLTWDARMHQFYGLTPSEQTADYALWVRHLHPEDRAGAEQAFQDALAGLHPFDTQFRIVWNDGTVRHLRATGRFTRDDQGRAVRVVGVNWDVSKVSELSLELERKEQMLRSVADSLPMLVNYTDLQQRYRFANQTYATWYGVSVEDIVGRRVADFLPPSTWAKVEPHLQAALQGTASVHENQLFVLGQQHKLRVQFIPQWDKGGQVEGVVTVVSDISEYKATEQRLAQAVEQATEKLRHTNEALVQRNLDLQQFSFIASHDLRTPLRSVKGYLTLLQARYASGLSPKAQELIERATAALGQMDGLTEDLLSYVRLDSPAQPLEPVDCNEVLRDTLNFLDASMAETGAQVTVETLPTVMGERGQLVQLFQNLLSNAMKYCQSDAPRIRVSAQRGASEWIFEVADNGIGIEPQHLTRIFEVFKRLHTAQEYPGTGIGLAICQRIAVRHCGRIWVTSEPGLGSSFFFSIPDKDKAL